MDIGKPNFFSLDRYLDTVSDMINADEVERALNMLDNLPAYYRDNIPERAKQMRLQLHKQLFTPVQYKEIYTPGCLDNMGGYWPARAQILENVIRDIYKSGAQAHVMEYAPGSFWLPYLLQQKALPFSYEHIGLDPLPKGLAFPSLQDGKESENVFVAFEIIEHLSNEWEIYQNYLKLNRCADHVLVSTPLYTYAGGMDNWQTRQLGHLRTYTPAELVKSVANMFIGLEWKVYTAEDGTIIAYGRRAQRL